MQPTRAGRQVMERMFKGLTPRADIGWPAIREPYVAMATNGRAGPEQEAKRRREEDEDLGTSDSPSMAEPTQRLEAATRRDQGEGDVPAGMDDAEEVVQQARNARRRTKDETNEEPGKSHMKRRAEDGRQEPGPVRRRITGKTSPEGAARICAGKLPRSYGGCEEIGANDQANRKRDVLQTVLTRIRERIQSKRRKAQADEGEVHVNGNAEQLGGQVQVVAGPGEASSSNQPWSPTALLRDDQRAMHVDLARMENADVRCVELYDLAGDDGNVEEVSRDWDDNPFGYDASNLNEA